MSQESLEIAAVSTPSEPRGTGQPVGRWVWPVLGLAAILLFELTANVALSAFVLCLKAGWSDFVAARWLARNERHRGRKRTLWYFQLALGAFKIVIAGVALSLILMFVMAWARAGGQRRMPLEAVAIVAVTAFAGFFLSSMLTLRGIECARWCGLRVWVDRRMARNVRHEYPPQRFSTYNELGSLVAGLAIFILGAVWVVGIVLALQVPQPMAVGVFIASVLLALAASITVAFRARTITARSPFECWPDADEEETGWREVGIPDP